MGKKKIDCSCAIVHLSKPFDSIDHQLLLKKLYSLGVSRKVTCHTKLGL